MIVPAEARIRAEEIFTRLLNDNRSRPRTVCLNAALDIAAPIIIAAHQEQARRDAASSAACPSQPDEAREWLRARWRQSLGEARAVTSALAADRAFDRFLAAVSTWAEATGTEPATPAAQPPRPPAARRPTPRKPAAK